MEIRRAGLAALFSASALAGCPNAELAPLEPCTVSGVLQEVTQEKIDQVDVLFMIDNSNSMAEEQAALARELPRMVQVLASGDLQAGQPDEPGFGESDFPAVSDMHLGVVTSDLGAAGNDPSDRAGCGNPGDNGLLQSEGDMGSCGVAGNFLTFDREVDDPVALGQTFACMTTQGTSGCGQEMQLDAMLKALVDPASGVTFYENSTGHGGYNGTGANAGFLRENAVLAVILVTDEDDCSVPDSAADLLAFPPNGPDQPLNMRCGLNPGMLKPTQLYIDELKKLKPQNPELVIFAAITGIPKVLEGAPLQDVLDDPTMQIRPDRDITDAQAQPQPSCTLPDPNDPSMFQKASPPRRIVEVAAGFGANGTVQSICQESFTGALNTIIEKISAQLGGACLPRPLTRDETGLVTCDIVEFIQDDEFLGDALCGEAQGREPRRRQQEEDSLGITHDYQVCTINQVAVVNDQLAPNPETGGSIGWYYDDFSEAIDECEPDRPQRISFTPDADPPQNALVRFECLQPVLDFGPQSKGKEAVGMSCVDNAQLCAQRSCMQSDVNASVVGCENPYTLECYTRNNTCQIVCAQTSNCPNGWVCQRGGDQNSGICVLPTCPSS